MKWILSIFLLAGALAVSAQPVPETDPGALFEQARQAYDRSDFPQAESLYEKLIQQGYAAPEVLFNLGNTCFRLGKMGAAIAHYRRAQYALPRDADLRANLAIAQQQVGALAPTASAWALALRHFSQREWHHLGLFAYWAAGLLAAGYLLGGRRPWMKRASLAALAVLAVSAAGWLHWQQLEKEPEAVIQRSGVQALFAPMAKAVAHFPLPEGSLVTVLEQSGSWLKIETGRQGGWVPEEACERLSLR